MHALCYHTQRRPGGRPRAPIFVRLPAGGRRGNRGSSCRRQQPRRDVRRPVILRRPPSQRADGSSQPWWPVVSDHGAHDYLGLPVYLAEWSQLAAADVSARSPGQRVRATSFGSTTLVTSLRYACTRRTISESGPADPRGAAGETPSKPVVGRCRSRDRLQPSHSIGVAPHSATASARGATFPVARSSG